MEIELSVLVRFIAIGVLIVFSAGFSATETSFFSLSKIQLRKIKNAQNLRARTISELLSKPEHLLITLLLGNELVNISISALSTSLVFHFFKDQSVIPLELLNVMLVVPFLLLCGEMIPKTLALKSNEKANTANKLIMAEIRYLFFKRASLI